MLVLAMDALRMLFIYSLAFQMTFLLFAGKFTHIIVLAPRRPSVTLGKEILEAVLHLGRTTAGTAKQKMVELHSLSPVSIFINFFISETQIAGFLNTVGMFDCKSGTCKSESSPLHITCMHIGHQFIFTCLLIHGGKLVTV